jgi:tetrahydromethanopterin S-methyltransferase subunit C
VSTIWSTLLMRCTAWMFCAISMIHLFNAIYGKSTEFQHNELMGAIYLIGSFIVAGLATIIDKMK